MGARVPTHHLLDGCLGEHLLLQHELNPELIPTPADTHFSEATHLNPELEPSGSTSLETTPILADAARLPSGAVSQYCSSGRCGLRFAGAMT